MLDEYRALVAILRRPMRRWWLSIGIWWLVMLVVIGIYQCWYTMEIHFVGFLNQGMQSYTLPYKLLANFNVFLRAAIPLLLWLAAATHVNLLINEKQDILASPMASRLPALRFLLFVSQGVWILLVFLLVDLAGTFSWNHMMQVRSTDFTIPGLHWNTVNIAFYDTIQLALCFTWVAALMATCPLRPVIAWLWAIPMYLLAPAVVLGINYNWVLTQNIPNLITQYTQGIPFSWVFGLLLVFTMIDGFRCRKPVLAYMGFSSLLVARFISSAFAYIDFDRIFGGSSYLPLIIFGEIACWDNGLRFVPAGATRAMIQDDILESGKLSFGLPPYSLTFSIPDWIIILAPLINMLWVLLIWFVLTRFVLVRRHELD
jgi:hypothetical protein